ncbi:Branched-chain amino acid aminotransferase/4-amino-4-deoxychorismate lyase IlvE [Methanonatronarchaeum thermophilum]|uniref:Branched-chain-amino-acid aminotransferase n=1 Tax=Methanonatronarchaeum thermophilum TaxID=1927129 RepID=A0A1Y3GCW3_9EURY|nr:branched-chain-amino-acid transaminase [Methanonatronarchaeum thermophilum]OUJ19239.1 Branched-chain amino acid aminotransferase/4-amino-4-deoxychorismate lyase IlvE [Methanonatronarchaeum thermophilum]
MTYVYIDGDYVHEEEASVSVFDHGLLYGDGVFEGIRAYEGKVFKLEEHIDRLYRSAKAIKLDIPITKKEMNQAIIKTLQKNELKNAYIRPLITRGVGSLGLDPQKCPKPTVIIIVQEWDAMYGDLYSQGLKAVTVAVRRNSIDALPPNIKSLNYLNNILAKIEANVKGGDEAIFLNQQGKISEGSGDNLFIIQDNQIYTPPALNNLKGITRKTAIDIAKNKGIEVQETDLGLFDIYTADEIFVTGTAAEIAPIVKVDGRQIGDGNPGKITKKLMDKFKEITGEIGTPIYG